MNIIQLPTPKQIAERAAHKALRVSRVTDQGSPRQSAGLMVMSGRMSDVCAELDRLVMQEQMRAMRCKAA